MTDRQQNVVAWWTDSENATASWTQTADTVRGSVRCDRCRVINKQRHHAGVTRHAAQSHLFPREQSGAG